MVLETKKIVVAPDSEVATLLAEALKAPLLVEVDGSIYRVSLLRVGTEEVEDIWAGYDAEKIRQAVA